MDNPYPQWFSDDELRLAHANFLQTQKDHDADHVPVVRLFAPDMPQSWLISEVNPHNNDMALGLGDLGVGHPELGYISLAKLASDHGPLRLPIERDDHFRPTATITEYAKSARVLIAEVTDA